MLDILYEDAKLVVCVKPIGVLSQPDVTQEGEDMLSLLRQQVSPSKGKKPWVGLVQRLDRKVGGLMVFGKRQDSTAALSQQIVNHTFRKEYLAVVHGVPDEPSGMWVDYLRRDPGKGVSYIVPSSRKDAKEASLSYRVIRTVETDSDKLTLLHIALHTGRTHQIRAQVAERKMPLVGDGKYGARDRDLPMGLWSYRLTFRMPEKRGAERIFCLPPPESHPVFSLFADCLKEELQPFA